MAGGATRRTARTRVTRRVGGAGKKSPLAQMAMVGGAILLIGFFAIYFILNSNPKVKILVAAKNLTENQQVTAADIKILEVPQEAVKLTKVYTNPTDPAVLGRKVNAPLMVGQMFTETILKEKPAPAPVAPPPKQIVKVDPPIPVPDRIDADPDEKEFRFLLPKSEYQAYMKPGAYVSLYKKVITPKGNSINSPVSKGARLLQVDDRPLNYPQKFPEQNIPVLLGLSKKDFAILTNAIEDPKGNIKFIEGINEEPPASTASIIQFYTGIQVVEKEIAGTVGKLEPDKKIVAAPGGAEIGAPGANQNQQAPLSNVPQGFPANFSGQANNAAINPAALPQLINQLNAQAAQAAQ